MWRELVQSGRTICRQALLLLRRPPRLQIAALCHKRTKSGLRVLIITSRGSERWILPKGWPMSDRKPHETAATEAYEEAGIKGEIDATPYASYPARKGVTEHLSVPTRVVVYLLDVRDEAKKFPEAGERKKRWLAPEKAAAVVDEEGLRDVLLRFASERANGRNLSERAVSGR
ncbi:MAG: NUDIX hydrolase [Rhodobiaceae bacterium]|nr:NUDIX hydrolase [Rhodobiaceae bacterium]MCC0054872.1 NUDIX hydrolase [Rhodobiaceae bacterium]